MHVDAWHLLFESGVRLQFLPERGRRGAENYMSVMSYNVHVTSQGTLVEGITPRR